MSPLKGPGGGAGPPRGARVLLPLPIRVSATPPAPLGENSPDRATETYDRSPSRTQLSRLSTPRPADPYVGHFFNFLQTCS
jgi:hypothetical protein